MTINRKRPLTSLPMILGDEVFDEFVSRADRRAFGEKVSSKSVPFD